MGGCPPTEHMKLIAKEWHAASDEVRKVFEAKVQELKDEAAANPEKYAHLVAKKKPKKRKRAGKATKKGKSAAKKKRKGKPSGKKRKRPGPNEALTTPASQAEASTAIIS